MDEGHSYLIVMLGIFLAATGGFAIVSSLIKIHNFQEGRTSSSVLETKLFKWNAPTALTYGILAVLILISLVYFDQLQSIKYATVLAKQDAANKNKASDSHINFNNPNVFTMDELAACSVLNGTVLISYNHESFSDSELTFKGVVGLSSSINGPFLQPTIKFKQGDQIFFKLSSGDIWSVNILQESGSLVFELSNSSRKQ